MGANKGLKKMKLKNKTANAKAEALLIVEICTRPFSLL